MDPAALERSLSSAPARPLLADARLVRRVIKRHRRLPGVGLQVPHARCYALRREALLSIVGADELGPAAGALPDDVILLPRPDRDEADGRSDAAILADLWRYAFHAGVHLEVERLAASGRLTAARIRERVHRIGETEFDEIRLVLRQDDLLLPPRDDREAYAEFAALYLELYHFAPAHLRDVFPTLGDAGATLAILAEDLDVPRLLDACRPDGAPPTPPAAAHEAEEGDTQPDGAAPVEAATGPAQEALLAVAGAARRAGNLVRSALTSLRAGREADARADVDALAHRLARALAPRGEAGEAPIDEAGWAREMFAMARHAVARRGFFRRIEARLLYDVQRACLAAERSIGTVDLAAFLLSLGRRPLTRLLPATREIRVARRVRDAHHKLARVALPEADRERLSALFEAARRRADENIRAALRPTVEEALRGAGLRPADEPERAAFDKIVEELLDHATAHGFLGLGLLRDAISRNQLKVPDLSGPRELFAGDTLLQADRRLARALDGVYLRGEIYLRGLQRLSSIFFGTALGRIVALYVVLPLGGAFVSLKGAEEIAEIVGHVTGKLQRHHKIELLTPWSFAATAVVLFGLLHVPPFRSAAFQGARAVGWLFAALFYHLPRWIASRPWVRAVLESRPALAAGRFVLKPAAATVCVHLAVALGAMLVRLLAAIALVLSARLGERMPELHAFLRALLHTTWSTAARAVAPAAHPADAVVFAAFAVFLNSRTGAAVEEAVLDAIARGVRRLERHVLPGLVRLVTSLFRRFTDAVDRGIYAVDEWLRFHEGQSAWTLAGKAVGGLAWFAIAYVLRLYVNLFIEPTFNPVKHFPVVTVAAKLMIPVTSTVAQAIKGSLADRIGVPAALALTGLVVLSIPGVFGFLVWELKENYKLYRATRAPVLRPVAIGHHGETMVALMKPGLHSGTLPKLYAKLRRATRKGSPAAERHKEALAEVAEAVERFADREMAALLRGSARWKGGRVHVAGVSLAGNRVKVRLGRDGGAPCVIAFEEQSGWLVGSVAERGWTADLAAEDRIIFENALAGLYQLAGVDLVREQIEAALPRAAPSAGAPPYDVSDEGLVVWPDGSYKTEIVYRLDAPHIPATVRGAPPDAPPPDLDRAALLFREQPIPWAAWVAAWSDAPPARVVKGASLLPA
jgi:hypothetical protein